VKGWRLVLVSGVIDPGYREKRTGRRIDSTETALLSKLRELSE
jgi:hypothetical protein